MKQLIRFAFGLLLAWMSASCATPTSVPPTATMPQATVTTQQVAEETAGVEAAQGPSAYPLSESGPYRVGVREFSAQDVSRDGREVGIRVWYPAVWPDGETNKRTIPKADPDRSGAPCTVILSWYGSGSAFGPHLASHGFLVAGVKADEVHGLRNIDSPLDLLFALGGQVELSGFFQHLASRLRGDDRVQRENSKGAWAWATQRLN